MNLPIAERELRVAARDRKTYRGRLIICLIFGAVAAWVIWFVSRYGPRGRVGTDAFTVMTMMAFMIVIMSAQSTADCISSEKREGTLGFLFLTDLRGYDIVLGKLAATGLASVYGLLAAIPAIALPLLIGGVGFESVAKTAAALLNTLFFSLCVGIWVSSRSFEQKKAVGGAVQIMMFFWIGIPLIAALLEYKYRWSQAADAVLLFAPVTQIGSAGPFAMGLTRSNFWGSFIAVHLMAWGFLLATCRRLPHAWQDKPRESFKHRFLLWWDQLRYGNPNRRAAHRKRLLRRSAIAWLCGREIMGPQLAWAIVAVACAAWVGLWLYFEEDGATMPGIGMPMVIVLQFIFFLRVIGLAAEVVARDRQTGALELLLSTKLTLKDFVRGHVLNILRICAGPIAVIYALGLIVLLGAMRQDLYEQALFLRIFVYLGILFGANLVGGFWCALWLGASSKNPAQATGLAMVRMLIVPLVVFLLTITLFAWLDFHIDGEHAFTMWWLMGLFNAWFWGRRCRRQFYENLRQIAAERNFGAGPRDGFFAWLGRTWGSFRAQDAVARRSVN